LGRGRFAARRDLRPRGGRRRPPAGAQGADVRIDERVAFIREALSDASNVEVDVFAELVVDSPAMDAKVIVMGFGLSLTSKGNSR
jgi:hypothetical protein